MAGLLRPTRAWAADANRAAFDARDLSLALKSLDIGNGAQPVGDKDVLINAPDIAENAALVAVSIVSRLPNTRTIDVLVEKNPQPLSAHFEFAADVLPEVSLRLKMAQTSRVWAIVKSNGKYYSANREIKITVGACG